MLLWNCGINGKIPQLFSRLLLFTSFGIICISLVWFRTIVASTYFCYPGRTYALGLRTLEPMEAAIDSLF